MRVLHEEPPMYKEAAEFFGLDQHMAVYFSYGDCVYNPAGVTMTAELIRHEETHLEQQAHDRTTAKIWWDRYLLDPAWRVEQEAEAYGAQYAFYCASHKDRNDRTRYLSALAAQLAGPVYGKCVKYSDAIKKINFYAHDGALRDIEKELD